VRKTSADLPALARSRPYFDSLDYGHRSPEAQRRSAIDLHHHKEQAMSKSLVIRGLLAAAAAARILPAAAITGNSWVQ